jgi:small subunit ribosomal protein S17
VNRNLRKQITAKVISISGEKTVKARIENRILETKYKKFVKIFKYLLVHDEEKKSKVGDIILVRETRPLSKNKRWLLVDILKNQQD